MKINYVNEVTGNLQPYPMEELARIKAQLKADGIVVYDFGTGDPLIPTWPALIERMQNSIPSISQYPSIKGTAELNSAQQGYLERTFNIKPSNDWMILPTRGSKEAIFHIALCLIGRSGKKRMIYPNPGYPVYLTSIQYAGGIPTPYKLTKENDYLLEPWTLDAKTISETAAIWVNYPHNPTGKVVDKAYWEKMIHWCHQNDVVLLSDDCYVDIYFDKQPICPLSISTDRVITFMSLSKRSGMTGYRTGFFAGDSRILNPVTKARANFGLATPDFIQKSAALAWSDDKHVIERKEIFKERIEVMGDFLLKKGLIKEIPKATFYMWCDIPKKFGTDDVKFCLDLAQKGVIASPSSWLGEGTTGQFRLALVPDVEDTKKAIKILNDFLG